MSEYRKKRYPADRMKLRDLLKKKEETLQDLKAEVEELHRRVKEADYLATNAIAEMYRLTPDQLAEILGHVLGDRSEPLPSLPPEVKVEPVTKPKPRKTAPDAEQLTLVPEEEETIENEND